MSATQKRYAALIGCIGTVCLLCSLFVIGPLDRERIKVKSETALLTAKLLDYQTTMLTINTYLERRRELENRRISLLAGLYNRDEVLEIVGALTDMAEKHHVRVKEISPSVEEMLRLNRETPADGAPQFLEMAIRIAGGFSGAGMFIRDLEQSTLFVRLQNLRVIERERGYVPAEYNIRFEAILGTSEKEMAAK
ncbi:MAG: hypothetical protein IH914_01320 [candidate division Zixibacteria bacterium]|nr:hypothetical protein [candidate division Zixibacteria bacterium]